MANSLDCDFDGPSGTPVIEGILTFIATLTVTGTAGMLKGTSITATPGADLTIEANTYKVYYTAAGTNVKQYVGEITTTGGNDSLTTLLTPAA